MSRSISLSYSQISTFKDCRRKWYLSYVLGYSPKMTSPKLVLGKLVHSALESFYKGGDIEKAYDQALISEIEKLKKEFPFADEEFEAYLNELEDELNLGREMVRNYKAYAEVNDPKLINKVISTELRKEVKLKYSVKILGYMDMIFQDRYGMCWIMEHKTANAISTDHLVLDEQASIYTMLAEKIFNLKFAGIYYNFIKKAVPQKPSLLKNGTLSKAKNSNITYETYMQAIKENNFNVADYNDILEYYSSQEQGFIRRIPVVRNESEKKEIAQRIQLVARDIKKAQNDIKMIYPHPTRDCSWKCQFRDVCIEMNNGGDYKFLLDRNFNKKVSDIKEEEV